MSEEALLLRSEDSQQEIENASRLVSFFGIPWRALKITEFLGFVRQGENSTKYRLVCSARTFLEVMSLLEKGSDASELWRERVHSVFVYAGDDSAVLLKVARILSRNERTALIEQNRSRKDYVVSDRVGAIGDVMAGVRIPVSNGSIRDKLIYNPSRGDGDIISAGEGVAFSKFEHHRVSVFLSTGVELINIETELPTGTFDIRDHVLQALPIVLYLKWAFGKTCWRAVETNACLIIDDPLLKPTYGFVNFHQLLSLMKLHRFSTNIAFIPWNWRRSDRAVVRMFKENPEEYSISVHGCDHIQAEFGDSDPQSLRWRSRQALERMARHEANTGLRHDRVMVFPQGVFSNAAMSVLKHSDFIAAANNDTLSADQCPRAITASDVWDVALMAYNNFPIFTRRYPWEGIENFAFDALLGKPLVAVIHHDFCSDQCARLITFVQGLNALKTNLRWTSLSEVARRSCKRRDLPGAIPEVEMYASELTLENSSDVTRRYAIKRRESDPWAFTSIQVGSQPTTCRYSDGYIRFEIELRPRCGTTVRVQFRDHEEAERKGLSTGIRTMLRRRICEVRDNYFMKYTPAFIAQRFNVN